MYTAPAPLPQYRPSRNKRKEMITIGAVLIVIVAFIVLIAAVVIPGMNDEWPEDGTYDLPAGDLIVRSSDLSNDWDESSYSPGTDHATLHLDGSEGSYLLVVMDMYASSNGATGVYESIKADYDSSGGSHNMGVGNRSCYLRMVFTDDGEVAFIQAAFQKGNVVVQFDYEPGYGSIELSDLKAVAEEQYRMIQN